MTEFKDTAAIGISEKIVISDRDTSRMILTSHGKNESVNPLIRGFVKITDKDTGEVIVDKANAVHAENMSIAIAKSLASRPEGVIQEMHFGNGGTTVNGAGNITYFPPNVIGSAADLYNRTYFKVVNDQSPLNTNPAQNFMQIKHTVNTIYTDIVIVCTLDYLEPTDQEAFDDTTDIESKYVFDEIGLKTYDPIPGNGSLVTHVIFSPIQKAYNRSFIIEYTLRIQIG